MRAAVALAAILGAGAAAAAPVPACDVFNARLTQAQERLQVPVPPVDYDDRGVDAAKIHVYETRGLKGISGELHCRANGQLESFQLDVAELQPKGDPHLAERLQNLMAAAIWAYTQWPAPRVRSAVDKLADDVRVELHNADVRGDPLRDGRGDVSVDDVVNLTFWGSADGLTFLIDATEAK